MVGVAGLYWLWEEYVNAGQNRKIESMPRGPQRREATGRHNRRGVMVTLNRRQRIIVFAWAD